MPLGAARLTLLAFQAVEVAVSADVIRKRVGIEALNSASVSTTASKFGGGSLRVTQASDQQLQFDNGPLNKIAEGDFTIECWVRLDSLSQSNTLIFFTNNGQAGRRGLHIYSQTLQYSRSGSFTITTGNVLTATNTWYHIAVVRISGTTRIYVDGALAGTDTGDSYTLAATADSRIGGLAGAFSPDGYIDEFRISDTARYTGGFSKPKVPFGNDANTLMLLHMDGTNGNGFFEDDAGEFGRHPVQVTTVGGNAQIDTDHFNFGNSSALFDGTDDYIDLSFRSDILTNTETIEFWYRPTSVSGVYGIMSQNTQGAGTGFQILQINGEIAAYKQANGGTTLQGGSLSAGTWVHIAVVNNGGNAALYIDGTSVDTDASWTGTVTDTDLRIGEGKGVSSSTWNATRYDLNGHIDELRISDSARYTAGFTVASDPFTNDENTRLLMHFEGSDTSTYFADDFGTRPAVGVQAIGNAQIDTSEYKFGGASGLFDGTGDYLTFPSFELAGDYTVECWFRVDNVSGSKGLIASNSTSPIDMISINNADVYWNRPFIQFTSTISANTWYHIAISRSGSTVRLFRDGVLQGSATNTDTIFPSSSNTEIRIGSDPFTDQMDGYIDEVRISNVCRYTQAFTAPTKQFTNDPNTLVLLHMDGTDTSTVFRDDNGATVPNSRGIASSQISAVNDAEIDTAIYKWGSSSLLLDGTNDRIEVSGDFRQTGDFTAECWFYPTSTSGTRCLFAIGDESSDRQFVNVQGSNLYTDEYGAGGVDINGTGGSITTNNWHHGALVREGSTVSLYLDGSRVGTTTSSATIGNANNIYIGTLSDGAVDFVGNIDEFRLSRVARYSGTSYTTPTAAFTDDSDTLLLLHMEGADGSTTFVEGENKRSQHGIKATGNGNTDNAQFKFGVSSYSATSQGNYLDIDDFGALGNGDWTMEAFVRYNVLSGAQMVFDWRPPSTQGAYPTLYVSGTSLIFYQSSGSRINSGAALSTGTWYHFALCKSGSSTKLFIDGTQVGSTYTDTNTYLGARLRLFGDGFTAGNATLDGFVDELRVSKSARYTANFTPTTESFQNDSNTLLLMHFDGTDGENDFTDDNGKEKN